MNCERDKVKKWSPTQALCAVSLPNPGAVCCLLARPRITSPFKRLLLQSDTLSENMDNTPQRTALQQYSFTFREPNVKRTRTDISASYAKVPVSNIGPKSGYPSECPYSFPKTRVVLQSQSQLVPITSSLINDPSIISLFKAKRNPGNSKELSKQKTTNRYIHRGTENELRHFCATK
jgi:hypothetical protein